MEYVFGTRGSVEVLKVKSGSHTDLKGFHQLVREYPDQVITDSFRVLRKTASQEDAAGNCYDWYEIDRHYRYTDKTGPVARQMADHTTNIEGAMCELDAGYDERVSAIEDALCELDEAIHKGGET